MRFGVRGSVVVVQVDARACAFTWPWAGRDGRRVRARGRGRAAGCGQCFLLPSVPARLHPNASHVPRPRYALLPPSAVPPNTGVLPTHPQPTQRIAAPARRVQNQCCAAPAPAAAARAPLPAHRPAGAASALPLSGRPVAAARCGVHLPPVHRPAVPLPALPLPHGSRQGVPARAGARCCTALVLPSAAAVLPHGPRQTGSAGSCRCAGMVLYCFVVPEYCTRTTPAVPNGVSARAGCGHAGARTVPRAAAALRIWQGSACAAIGYSPSHLVRKGTGAVCDPHRLQLVRGLCCVPFVCRPLHQQYTAGAAKITSAGAGRCCSGRGCCAQCFSAPSMGWGWRPKCALTPSTKPRACMWVWVWVRARVCARPVVPSVSLRLELHACLCPPRTRRVCPARWAAAPGGARTVPDLPGDAAGHQARPVLQGRAGELLPRIPP